MKPKIIQQIKSAIGYLANVQYLCRLKCFLEKTGIDTMAEATTPLMKQYWEIKSKYPEAMLLYRVGDFYETFGEDAILASKALGIVLTRKANGAKTYTNLAGFPHHALDTYLPKLIRAGYKVAVCDQLEDPKNSVKIVKRGVTELVTPGVAYNDQLLVSGENNFLAALYNPKGIGYATTSSTTTSSTIKRTTSNPTNNKTNTATYGISFLDISTGTYNVGEGDIKTIDTLLAKFAPKEVLITKGQEKDFKEIFGTKYCITTIDDWAFVQAAAMDKLCKHFNTENLKGFGVENMTTAICAAGAILFYLDQTCHTEISHITSLQRIDDNKQMWLDRFSIRNLELFPKGDETAKGASLIEVVDKTLSPMGARLLRRWIAAPLTDKAQIDRRLDIVNVLLDKEDEAQEIRRHLMQIGDLERLVSKAAAGRLMPKEMAQLRWGLTQIPAIKEECQKIENKFLQTLASRLNPCEHLNQLLQQALAEEPASQFGKGDVIASGYNKELDELRYILNHGKDYLKNLQDAEAERTGIASLKISYNSVFGYYIEVRNTYKDKVPAEWIRKQTLVNAERYITEELKQYEEKILGAQEQILNIEQQIYATLIENIRGSLQLLQQNAMTMAIIDCLQGFATLARERNYCRPTITEDFTLDIKQGRHPVIESLMPQGDKYIANDVYLDNDSNQIIILTGPNMAGKSALLRQTALIVLLAQCGSYVPAEKATLGIVDKLFTRVGASDNISRGESTFMVEMLESSAILNNVSERSLVLLDEIGRGTSTYDGLSIAWAMVDYLHNCGKKPKTLFATHYHELNILEETLPRVKNFHISVKEAGNKVIFLRKLERGGIRHSFGIHVARMAGMPKTVLEKAEKVLADLEKNSKTINITAPIVSSCADSGIEPMPTTEGNTLSSKRKSGANRGAERAIEDAIQLSFYTLDDPLLTSIKEEITKVDLNSLSPLAAFDLIRNLKHKLGLDS